MRVTQLTKPRLVAGFCLGNNIKIDSLRRTF